MTLDKKLVQWVLKMLKAKPNISATENYSHVVDSETFDGRNKILPGIDAQTSVPEYAQVFQDKIGFKPNMSILDLLFCNGPASSGLLRGSDDRF